jgi:hypothetical protein
MTNIEKASNLELLIELMYDGKSRMVESLVDEEPVDTKFIYQLLASRTGKSFGNKFEYWYEWFIDSSTNETASEKHALKWLHDFKHQFEKLMQGACNESQHQNSPEDQLSAQSRH